MWQRLGRDSSPTIADADRDTRNCQATFTVIATVAEASEGMGIRIDWGIGCGSEGDFHGQALIARLDGGTKGVLE